MKITGYEATTLKIPEDDPLADMPEEAGRTRPVVILRLRTDDGIEGIAVTLYGGAMTGSLRVALEELAQIAGCWYACWCSPPLPCHGHVLARAAAWAAEVLRTRAENQTQHGAEGAP